MLSFCHVRIKRVESSAARLRGTRNIWTRLKSRIKIMSWFDLHSSSSYYCTYILTVKDHFIPAWYQPNQLTSDSLALIDTQYCLVFSSWQSYLEHSNRSQSVLVNSRVVVIPTWRASHLLLSLDASFDLFSAVGDVPPFYFVCMTCSPFFNRSTSTSLPNQAFWSKFKPKGKEPEDKQGPMSVARQRLMTLAYGEFETLLKVCPSSHFCLVDSQITSSQLPSSFNVCYLLN